MALEVEVEVGEGWGGFFGGFFFFFFGGEVLRLLRSSGSSTKFDRHRRILRKRKGRGERGWWGFLPQ